MICTTQRVWISKLEVLKRTYVGIFATLCMLPFFSTPDAVAQTPVVADSFPGADLGAKIKAALASRKNATGPIEIIVNESGSIKTPVELVGPVVLRFGTGIFQIEGSLKLSGSHTAIVGSGSTRLVVPASSQFRGPMITIASGSDYWKVQNLVLHRDGEVKQGDHGIYTFGINGHGLIEDVIVNRQDIGLYLGPTGHSYITRTKVLTSLRHGIMMENNTKFSACQYNLTDIHIEQNGGNGIHLLPAGRSMQLGNWTKVSTFWNVGAGMYAERIGDKTVESVRLTDGFFGNDGRTGRPVIFLGGGTLHQFTNLFIEIAGQTMNCNGVTCEAPYYSAPTHGIVLDSGVGRVLVSNAIIEGTGGNGIVTSARSLQISNATIVNNGRMGKPGTQGGIVVTPNSPGAELMVSNTTFSNDTNTQLVSVQAPHGSKVTITSSSAPDKSFAVPSDAILSANRMTQ